MSDVIVIGGGCTGTGVARDLSLRGLSVTLIERGDLAAGTTGRCHGVLHSGARYAVTDHESAQECARENLVLKSILSPIIEDTGGIFASVIDDDYVEHFLKGCTSCGITADELSPQEALEREPSLNPDISNAVLTPDASCDTFKATIVTALDAVQHGAEIKPYTAVVGVVAEESSVVGVRVNDGARVYELRADAVVNATGPWAKSLSSELECSLVKGSHVVVGERLVRSVVHHLRPPTEGDILVPLRGSTILGTTSVDVAAPVHTVTEGEVRRLVEECATLIPNVKNSRLIRAYAGTRVLFGATRQFCLINDWENFFTVAGGKWTTHRRIAEVVSDAVCDYLGVHARCTTAVEPVTEGAFDVTFDRNGHDRVKEGVGGRVDVASTEDVSPRPMPMGAPAQLSGSVGTCGGDIARYVTKGTSASKVMCFCESVPSYELSYAIERLSARTIDDVMRRTRAGFGPCQGSFCSVKVAAELIAHGKDPTSVQEDLKASLRRRSSGVRPILGESEVQLQQEILKRYLYELYGNYDDLRPHTPYNE
ncbi:MAG: FAD-dependent oxidoreductase [Halobacteriota archaeon]